MVEIGVGAFWKCHRENLRTYNTFDFYHHVECKAHMLQCNLHCMQATPYVTKKYQAQRVILLCFSFIVVLHGHAIDKQVFVCQRLFMSLLVGACVLLLCMDLLSSAQSLVSFEKCLRTVALHGVIYQCSFH